MLVIHELQDSMSCTLGAQLPKIGIPNIFKFSGPKTRWPPFFFSFLLIRMLTTQDKHNICCQKVARLRCLAQSVDLGVSGFIYLFWYENSRYCFEKCLKEDCRLLTYLDCLIYKHNFSLYIKWSRLSGFPMVLTIGKPRNQETTSGNEQKKYLSIFVYSSVVRVWVFFYVRSSSPFPAK